MTESTINYLGPAPGLLPPPQASRRWWQRVPVAFLVVVGVPTVLTALYYFFLASPLYVSESRFVVRQANQQQASPLGFVLQGVGLSTSSFDAYAVHEYALSQDGVAELERSVDLEAALRPRGLDFITGWPRFGESPSEASKRKALKRFVVVGLDATTGISTLRVESFEPKTAQRINLAMLASGERLVNRLNDRAMADALSNAERSRDEARSRLADVQSRLAAYRNREQFVDPTRQAIESTTLIGSLMANLASLRAERAQLAAQAPSSPQLPTLDARIAAYEQQIASERSKVAGSSDSLASRISGYQALELELELTGRELAEASSSLVSAQQEARRQKLYLERIVNPSLPDKSTEPRRLMAVFTVLASTLLLYSLGWLVWAGVREHRQL